MQWMAPLVVQKQLTKSWTHTIKYFKGLGWLSHKAAHAKRINATVSFSNLFSCLATLVVPFPIYSVSIFLHAYRNSYCISSDFDLIYRCYSCIRLEVIVALALRLWHTLWTQYPILRNIKKLETRYYWKSMLISDNILGSLSSHQFQRPFRGSHRRFDLEIVV